MRKLQDMIGRLKELELRLVETISKAIRENEDVVIEMNIDDQLYVQGVNRNGVSISDYAPYSMLTLEIKSLKGQPTDRVTLQDTGDFHNSFFIDYGNESFEIKATDWKTEDLVMKYGQEIF